MNDYPRTHRNLYILDRREFLKYTGLSLTALFLPRISFSNDREFSRKEDNTLLARVTYSGHTLHREPNSESNILMRMAKDSVLRITGVTVGEEDGSPNRIW